MPRVSVHGRAPQALRAYTESCVRTDSGGSLYEVPSTTHQALLVKPSDERPELYVGSQLLATQKTEVFRGGLVAVPAQALGVTNPQIKRGTGSPIGSPRPCMKFAYRRYATVASSNSFEALPAPCAMAGWQNRIPISRRPVRSPSVRSG